MKSQTDVVEIINRERERQQNTIELIPSENYVSADVLKALGSVFTNKYAEGYPGARYYGGQEFTDQIEQLAIDRACELFNCKYANVQPLSGAPANLAVYAGLLEPGDTVLGMDLSHGGHLTHGHPVTFPAMVYNFVRYKMSNIETGELDYDALRETALAEKPKIILVGFSAYSRELDYEKFVAIAKEVGAITVADISHIAGLIAGGVARNPFDAGFDIITTTTHKTLRGPRGGMILVREDEGLAKKINKSVFPGLQGGPHMNNIAAKAVAFGEALDPTFKKYTQQVLDNAKAMEAVFRNEDVRMIGGGTSNHLLLLDVQTSFGVSGKKAQTILESVSITTNMNMIPDDPRSPRDPSGLRLGTPAVTTRGFGEAKSTRIAGSIVEVLRNPHNSELHKKIRQEIDELAQAYPVPEIHN